MIFYTDYNIFLNRTKISGSLHEKVSIFVCWRQHKFELKYFCTAVNIFISSSGTCLNSIHRKHCCASLTTMLKRKRHNVVVSYFSVLDISIQIRVTFTAAAAAQYSAIWTQYSITTRKLFATWCHLDSIHENYSLL
jgi:hypothetical protein